MSMDIPPINIDAFAKYVLTEDDDVFAKLIFLEHIGKTADFPILRTATLSVFNKQYKGEANTVFNAIKRALEAYRADMLQAGVNFNKVLEKFEETED